jgi:1-acyl-sn-glycerol-3-phosphate acyltransferase
VGASPRSLPRSAVALLVLPVWIALLAAVGIAASRFGASARAQHRLYLAVARLALRIGGTRLEVAGRERLEAGAPYVVVSNHESAWDPLCLLAGLPELVLRFVVKRPIMRIPLLGAALRATGNVEVLRTDTRGDVARLEAHMGRREAGVSMLFFAEGTRSRDGALHPFKKGPFATALRSRLAVLPVAVAGTYRMWPKGRLGISAGAVVVEVGAPIPVGGLGESERAALREQSFAAVRELRAKARARLRARGCEPGGVD